MAVSNDIRQRVWLEAASRCGYCLTTQALVWGTLEIEHLRPRSLGGDDSAENLWLACSRCNKHKASRMFAVDPQTSSEAEIFNPRTQSWLDHFRWSDNGIRLIGLTPIGRTTVAALQLNDENALETRALWVRFGLHPPSDVFK